jgi:LPS sulfotransferase NodH
MDAHPLRWFQTAWHSPAPLEKGRLRPMIASYIICTTPRSGSTLLCKLLASTGKARQPDSFYHRSEFMREWADEWGLSDSDTLSTSDFERAYLAAAVKAGGAGTGIFGLRLQQEYLRLLSQTLDLGYPKLLSDRARFEHAFGRTLYLHLTREDKVAQAVSLVKAQQSGFWHLNADGTELERLAEPQEVHYDFERIHREVVALEHDDHAWDIWFKQQEIIPVRIRYETLADNPSGTLIQMFDTFEIEPSNLGNIEPEVAKLADAESLEWMRRFRADLQSTAK